MAAKKSRGRRPPTRGTGRKPPTRGTGRKPPARGSGRKPPTKGTGRKPPAKKPAATKQEVAKKQPVETSQPESVVISKQDQKMVDEACQEISSILEKTLFKGTIEVGQYVLKTFFDDDPKVARSRGRKKGASFRLLTDRCDTGALPVSKSWLHSAVGLAIQDRELVGHGGAYQQLTPTHRVRLLPVKSPDEVDRLAQEVLEEELTTRQLQERVAEVVANQPRRPGGRRPKNPLVKALERASRTFTIDGKPMPIRAREVKALEEQDARQALEAARVLSKKIEEVVKKLEARLQKE